MGVAHRISLFSINKPIKHRHLHKLSRNLTLSDTNVIEPDFLTRIINRLEKNNADEIDVIDFKLTNPPETADMTTNFCSEPLHCTLKYKRDGKTCQKCLFVKIPYSISKYEIISEIGLYRRELHMYESVFPLFEDLLVDEPSLWPKFYCSDGKDALVLEDLSQDGYVMLKTYDQLDFEHCVVALRALATFHALSVRIDETRPRVLDAVRSEVVFTPPIVAQFAAKHEERLLKVLSSVDAEYAKRHAGSVARFAKQLFQLAADELQPCENGFNVLNHGDFWANNALFRYDSAKRALNVKLIDFQNCRWSSPASDVVYFAINSIRFEVFESSFDQLLDIYRSTLNATMKRLNCERHSLSSDELKRSIESKYNYWIVKLITTLPHVLNRRKRNGDFYDESLIEEEAYIDLARKWMRYFVNKGKSFSIIR